MSKMKELYEKVAADSTLQAKFAEIMKDAKEAGEEATKEKLIAFAKETGYDITLEEIQDFFKELAELKEGELSDIELDQVAGGKSTGQVLASVAIIAFCGLASAVGAITNTSCGKLINDQLDQEFGFTN